MKRVLLTTFAVLVATTAHAQDEPRLPTAGDRNGYLACLSEPAMQAPTRATGAVPGAVRGAVRAQDSEILASVVTQAPIFIRPGAVTPLRVAAVGTTLKVLQEQRDWCEVEFRDPQIGPRVGWIETKAIAISRPNLRPMDLSIDSPAFQQEPVDLSVPTTALAPADAIQRERAPQAAFNKREPVVALALSAVLPGLGQLYNGPTETKKGVAMLGAQAGFYALTWFGAFHNTCSTTELYSYKGCGVSPLTWIGFAGLAGNSINSMYDAYTKAGALNRRHGLALSVKPEVVNGRNGVSAEAHYQFSW